MQMMIFRNGRLVPDARGREMLVRMIAGLMEGRSREEIVADEMALLTPVAPDRAEARDSDDESPTRAAGEHDG